MTYNRCADKMLVRSSDDLSSLRKRGEARRYFGAGCTYSSVSLVKRHITLHVLRRDVLLHALGGFAEPGPMAARLWSSQEDEYLRQTYTFIHRRELWERLPRRTPGAIRRRACTLGLTRTQRQPAIRTDSQYMRHEVLGPAASCGAAPLPPISLSYEMQERPVPQVEKHAILDEIGS